VNHGGLQADLKGGSGGAEPPREKNSYFVLPSAIGAKIVTSRRYTETQNSSPGTKIQVQTPKMQVQAPKIQAQTHNISSLLGGITPRLQSGCAQIHGMHRGIPYGTSHGKLHLIWEISRYFIKKRYVLACVWNRNFLLRLDQAATMTVSTVGSFHGLRQTVIFTWCVLPVPVKCQCFVNTPLSIVIVY